MKKFVFACALLCMAAYAFAQDEVPTSVTIQNMTGEMPFSSSVGTSIEHVDVASGALNISIPLFNVGGRGPSSTVSWRWNSYYLLLAPRTDALGRPFFLWTIEKMSGWQPNSAIYFEAPHARITCDTLGTQFMGYATVFDHHIYIDAAGAKHAFPLITGSGWCAPPNITTAADPGGIGMSMTATSSGSSAQVVMPDGATVMGQMFWSGFSAEDTDGNYLPNGSSNTLGRSYNTTAGGTTNADGTINPIVYTVRDSNAIPQTYTITWQQVSVVTSFGQFPTGGRGATKEASYLVNAIQSIQTPAGTYQFHYDDPYGEMTEIDLPTGGVIRYTWSTFIDGLYTRRYVASRTEVVNGTSATWTFQLVNPSPTGGGVQTGISSTVTFPVATNAQAPTQNDQSVYVSDYGAVTDAKIYSGSATGIPLREHVIWYGSDDDPTDPNFDQCYNSEVSPPLPAPVGQRPTRIITIFDDGTATKKELDYETFSYSYYPSRCSSQGLSAQPQTFTASRGNVTAMREYGFGAIQRCCAGTGNTSIIDVSAPLLRTTSRTYLHTANSAYLAANIVNKVLSETVTDSTVSPAQTASQTQYEYDQYGTSGMIATTNLAAVPDHDATRNGTFTVRGNVTAVKKWRNTDGALLSTKYTYDDLGNIRSITDPLG